MQTQRLLPETDQDIYEWSAVNFCRRLTALCLFSGFVGAVGVLWQWFNGTTVKTYVVSVQPVISPNTATIFILASVSFFILWLSQKSPWRLLAKGLALVIIVFCLLTFAQFIFHVNFGIDTLLFHMPKSHRHPYPGRLAPVAALVLLLVGFALWFFDFKTVRGAMPSQWFALLIGLFSALALMGYFTGARAAYSLFSSTMGMSFYTAMFSTLLAIAFLCARCQEGFMALFVSKSVGGAAARSLFWLILITPVVLNALMYLARYLGVADATCDALYIVFTFTTFAIFTWRVARKVHQIDGEQQNAEAALRREKDQQVFLAKLGNVLTESLDFEWRLEQTVRHCVPYIADWCMIDLVETTPQWRKTAIVYHADVAKQVLAEKYRERFSAVKEMVGGPFESALLKQSFIHTNINYQSLKALNLPEERIQILQRLGVCSSMVVPLCARDRALGTISFVSAHRNYTAHDLHFAEQITRHAALAADNARLYQEARRALRARQDTLAIVSHDLKTPLSAVELASELMLKQIVPKYTLEKEAEDEFKKMAMVIKRSSQQAFHLISDLLDLSKMESGSFSIETKPMDSQELMEITLTMMRPLAEKRGLQLENLSHKNFEVNCDQPRIVQVLSNLIGNAIKFSSTNHSTNQKIIVNVEPYSDASILFSVQDFGIGISEESASHIFDRYWQHTESKRQGTGLGLSIAKGIVEAHGGKIWVNSQLKQGSTFYFTLRQSQKSKDQYRNQHALHN